ncbi:MAG: recombinase family protein [Parasporobacterium sp.]|nr:recombinase family protein [Parasporobacterium sp.]
MTYAKEIKERIYSPSIVSPVRAGIYARVSTDNDSQKESCMNQVEMAESFIREHPNITLQRTYIDDGISGKSDYNRPEYNQMLRDVEAGKLDLIIVKALSRLNRDEYNSLALINLLREKEVTILTLEDSCVHDFEDRKERLFNSIRFAMDADYVSDQSEKGRMTHKLRCERKELSAKDISFGYKWDRNTKTISIQPEEAEMVVYIFETYVYRSGTPASIKRDLEQKGRSLSERTLTNILQDERYIGRFFINKRTTKLGTGKNRSKRKVLPREEWVLVERADLRIIDDDLFEMAQRIRQTRKTIYYTPDKKQVQAYFQGTHLFSGKIFCANCNKPFHFGYADRKGTIPVYRIKKHSDCAYPAKRIGEQELEEIVRIALKEVINSQKQVCEKLEQILSECIKEACSEDNDHSVQKQKQQLRIQEKRRKNLIDILEEGGLDNESKKEIKSRMNIISTEINKLREAIDEAEAMRMDDSFITNKVEEIKAAIAELRSFTKIDRERVLNYITRINIHESGDIDVILRSGKIIKITSTVLKTTENTSEEMKENCVVKMSRQDMTAAFPLVMETPPRIC